MICPVEIAHEMSAFVARLAVEVPTTLEDANQFLRDEYIAEFNRRFRIQPTQPGSAFLSCRHQDLDLVFSIQQTRTVARDNTIQLGTHWLQIERTDWRGSLAGCRVLVHEHLDDTRTIRYGPQVCRAL